MEGLLKRGMINEVQIELFKGSEDCIALVQGHPYKLRAGCLERLTAHPWRDDFFFTAMLGHEN
jgi:hypothetical protein